MFLYPQFLLPRVSSQLLFFSPNTLPDSLGLTHFSLPAQKTSYLRSFWFPNRGSGTLPWTKVAFAQVSIRGLRHARSSLSSGVLPRTPRASGRLCHIHHHITNWDIKQSEIKNFKTIWQMTITEQGLLPKETF